MGHLLMSEKERWGLVKWKQVTEGKESIRRAGMLRVYCGARVGAAVREIVIAPLAGHSGGARMETE
jgi:hypothetical protein